MIPELHYLCRLDELEEEIITGRVLPNGDRVAIYLVEGEVFVTDDRCSHGEASLTEEGIIDGCQVECSWHFGRFDIRTGQPTSSPCTEPIGIYRVSICDGGVYVSVSSALRIESAQTSVTASGS